MSDLDPEFLELEDVFELHADSIARYGGDLGVRDRGLIESAVAAFLAMNEHDLIEQGERLYATMIAISAQTLDKAGLVAVFEECSQPIREEPA